MAVKKYKMKLIPFSSRDPEEFIHSSLPLDYSFMKIANLKAAKKKPRKCRLLSIPPKGATNRFVTRSYWLNNNNLKDISNLYISVIKHLEQPEALKWLDLSFNLLCDISEEILKFQNLMILYLHGNRIKALTALTKLCDLKSLRSLTLRGNPIEGIYGYRSLVLNLLPQLNRFDYCSVCSCDRDKRLCPCFGEELLRQFSEDPNDKRRRDSD